MSAFHSCLEILFRPEGPEVILCSLSRAAPSSPSPALAPGTSLPVRRGGRHGGGVAAVCVPGVPVGWRGCPPCPLPAAASPAHRGQRPPATKATGLHTPLQKKKNTEKVSPGPLLVLPGRGLASGAWLLSVRRRCCGCRRGLPAFPCRCFFCRSGACPLLWFSCVGVAGGGPRCRCSLCVVLRRPRQPRWRWCGVGLPLFLRVARFAWSGRGGVARNQGEVGQHTGLPAVPLPLFLGGHWWGARGGHPRGGAGGPLAN